MSNQPQLPSMFRVCYLLAGRNHLLLVFYTSSHCYEFRVVTPQGKIVAGKHIFYAAEAALREGRDYLIDSWSNC